jgi:hypothetical protein
MYYVYTRIYHFFDLIVRLDLLPFPDRRLKPCFALLLLSLAIRLHESMYPTYLN